MAPESCNLGKDEAEILKPSSPSSASSSSSSSSSTSSSSSSSSTSPPQSNPPPSSTSSQLSPPFLAMEPSHQAQSSDERPETAIVNIIKASSLSKQEEKPHPPVQFGKRCSTCQKRIGLTGFRCRCGDLFCARHRYSDTHGCSFDYKAAGREEISKANPVIRAAKIIKI